MLSRFTWRTILGGIASYGNSRLQLRAADDNSESWMKVAFSGFKIPLDLAWLTFRICVVFMIWMILALIPSGVVAAIFFAIVPKPQTPGELASAVAVVTLASAIFIAIYCVPFYMYRYLFRIKADHPDWSAGECMRHCRELVCGSKWRIFVHDCSYWRILLGAAILLQVCSQVIITIVNGVVYRLGVFNITAMTNMIEERIPLPEFTPRIILELASSTVLIFFLSLWSRAFRLSSCFVE